MAKNKVISNIPHCLDTFHFFLESDIAPLSKAPIYIFTTPEKSEDYILMNCEQMTRESQRQKIIAMYNKMKPLEVWDYSIENCNILKNLGIIAKHVPLRTPQWYFDILKSFRNNLEYDVGFCGSLSNRRKIILDQLREKGVSVNDVKGWSSYRDKELAKCRIHINIHYDDDYNIFESARCEPWLTIGIPVISENSLDNDSRCINVDYTSLVKTVVDFLDRRSF